jgi:hypothetical protein
MPWPFAARMIGEALVGMLLLVAAALLALGKRSRGLQLGHLGLLFSLTTVDLLLFYFDQFATVLAVLAQFALLLGIAYYNRRLE